MLMPFGHLGERGLLTADTRAKIKADPALDEAERAYQKAHQAERRAKIKADPALYEAYLKLQRQRDAEYRGRIKADPAAHESYIAEMQGTACKATCKAQGRPSG